MRALLVFLCTFILLSAVFANNKPAHFSRRFFPRLEIDDYCIYVKNLTGSVIISHDGYKEVLETNWEALQRVCAFLPVRSKSHSFPLQINPQYNYNFMVDRNWGRRKRCSIGVPSTNAFLLRSWAISPMICCNGLFLIQEIILPRVDFTSRTIRRTRKPTVCAEWTSRSRAACLCWITSSFRM